MRFYADEQFDARSVTYLRRKHKVKHVIEFPPLRKRDDAFHHTQSKREKRILVTCDCGFADAKYPVNRHPGILIIATKPQDYRAINTILDQVLRLFRTAADFYEAKIIASTTGWRRITREGEGRGEWEVTIREEWSEQYLPHSAHRFQTLGADVQTLGDVALSDGHFLDVGLPLAFGLFMGMTDIVPKLRALTTNIALGH